MGGSTLRLIFLDVDGVLNHSGCKVLTPSGYYFVEEDKLALLREIVDATGAEIVLSSSWRKGYYEYAAGHLTDDAKDYLLLEETLADHGMPIIGYTPMHDTAYRGTEIVAWLKEHTELDVEGILILDDDKDMKPLDSFLIRTSFFSGLTQKQAAQAVSLLLGDEYPKFVREGGLDRTAEKRHFFHSRVKE